MVASIPSVMLGGVIAHHGQGNVVGPLVLLVGLLASLVLAVDAWGLTATTGTPWPAADVAHQVAVADCVCLYIGPIALALVPPTGCCYRPGGWSPRVV